MKFQFTLLAKYDEGALGVLDDQFVVGEYTPKNPAYWDKIETKELSIAGLFYIASGYWNYDRLCSLTEPLADKIENKSVVVEIDNGKKTIIAPPKDLRLYFRPWKGVRLEDGDVLPYTEDNLKACAMTAENAEALAERYKSGTKKKGRTYRVESINTSTLF